MTTQPIIKVKPYMELSQSALAMYSDPQTFDKKGEGHLARVFFDVDEGHLCIEVYTDDGKGNGDLMFNLDISQRDIQSL